MTEAIKQWIYQKSRDYANDMFPSGHVTAVAKTTQHHESGLTKGIEIAEGFANWKSKIGATQRTTGYWIYPNCVKPYSTSELLEQYLKTLEP